MFADMSSRSVYRLFCIVSQNLFVAHQRQVKLPLVCFAARDAVPKPACVLMFDNKRMNLIQLSSFFFHPVSD